MERKVMFDINALISPSVEEKLDSAGSLSDKIDILFNLLDFTYADFCDVEKVEIQEFYTEKMGGMPPESFALSDDKKDFIKKNYAVCFNDFEEVKNLFNEILGGDDEENAISEATYRIHEEYDRRKKEADKSMQRILENLIFDEDVENEDSTDNSNVENNNHSEKSELNDSAPTPIRRRRLNTSFRQLAAIRASKQSNGQNQENQS